MHPTPQNDADDSETARLMHATTERDADMRPVTENDGIPVRAVVLRHPMHKQ